MKIKRVCEMTGLTPRAVRLYCERGLIQPSQRERGGRIYREFSRQDADTLWRIGVLRRLGFSLEEIGGLLAAPQEAAGILARRADCLERSQAQAQRLLGALRCALAQPLLNFETMVELLEEALAQPLGERAPSRPMQGEGSWQGEGKDSIGGPPDLCGVPAFFPQQF